MRNWGSGSEEVHAAVVAVEVEAKSVGAADKVEFVGPFASAGGEEAVAGLAAQAVARGHDALSRCHGGCSLKSKLYVGDTVGVVESFGQWVGYIVVVGKGGVAGPCSGGILRSATVKWVS